MYHLPTARCSRWLFGFGVAMGISFGLSFSYAGATGDEHSVLESSNLNVTAPAAAIAENDKRWVSSALVPADGKVLLRTLPVVSAPISVGGTTVMPYFGAGFKGGYANEVDRSLNTPLSTSPSSSSPTDVGLRSLAGQMIPNEVQVGIRFPF